MRTVKVAFVCGVALSAIAASAVTTNVWKGAESGGMWNVQGNWSEPLKPAVTTVYDFSNLTDGAVVTNNYVYTKDTAEQLKIAGLIFGESKGTVTLFGTSNSETIFVNPLAGEKGSAQDKTVVIDIPDGTTFDCQLRHTTGPWKDQASILVFNSPGTVKFSGAQFVPTMWTVKFACSGASAIFENVADVFKTSKLQFDSISRTTVTVSGDFWIGEVVDGKKQESWPADANRIVGDGFSSLKLCSGYGFGNDGSVKYTMITNFQSVVMSGGGTEKRQAPIFATQYIFNNYALTYGEEFVSQDNQMNNINGGIQFVPNAAVDIDGPTRLRTYCNQVLSTLSGTGTHGIFDVGGTWNNETDKIVAPGSLTVGEGIASATSTVFNARLTGIGGGFVKKGSDYNLTLTGANTYTGATQVVEGQLTLKRDIAYDSAWWWSFDDEFGVVKGCKNVSPNMGNITLQVEKSAYNDNMWHIEDGVNGSRAVYIDGANSASLMVSGSTNNFTSIVGDVPHTLQLWIRPEKDGCYACVPESSNKLTYIADLGPHWTPNFTRSRIVLAKNKKAQDDYWLIFTPKNYNSSTVEEGYGVNVPIKEDSLFDGQWHQLTYVYRHNGDDRFVEAYVDGVFRGDDKLISPMNIGETNKIVIGYASSNSENYYSGGVDELKVIPRALSAAEVRRSFVNAQNSLEPPKSVMHWKFDDENNIGADSCGNAPLSSVEGQSSATLGAATFAIEGVALGNSKPMCIEEYPECLPTGNQPFSVSCRYMPNGNVANSPIVWWGNPSKAYGYFRIQTTDSGLRSPGVGYSDASSLKSSWKGMDDTSKTISHSTGVSATGEFPSGWVDFTVTYDGAAGNLRMYADGALVGTKSDVALNIEGEGYALHVGYQTIGTKTNLFPGIIDDIQIYDWALSDEEVRLAVRSLHGENLDRVIVNSPVSVSEGATLAFVGPGHTLSALSSEKGTVHIEHESDFTMNKGVHVLGKLTGRGLLNLPEGCDLTVSDASDFAGTVNLSGGASFAMSPTGDAMSANVYAEEGACLKAAQQTAPIRTTGRVVISSSVTVKLPSIACSHFPMYLAEAGGITMSDDIEWQFCDSQGDLLPEFRSACFRIEKDETGLVVRKFRKEGTTVLIR